MKPLLIAALLLLAAPLWAQEPVVLPFSIDEGAIVVHLSMNGKEGAFILDTGSTWTIADAAFLNLKVELAKSKFTSNGGFRGEAMAERVDVRIADRHWLEHPIAVMDLTHIAPRYKTKIVGLLGQRFLSQFGRVTIDFKLREIRLES